MYAKLSNKDALYRTVAYGYKEGVESLISQKANVNQQSIGRNWEYPILEVCARCNMEIIQLLLSAGASLEAITSDSANVFHLIAVYEGILMTNVVPNVISPRIHNLSYLLFERRKGQYEMIEPIRSPRITHALYTYYLGIMESFLRSLETYISDHIRIKPLVNMIITYYYTK